MHEQPADHEITRSEAPEPTVTQADLPYEISRRLIHLNESYPGEKLYIHTDKSHYLPGETVWFKLYLADASSHLASPWSRLVYVELADTAGMVAGRRYIEIKEGTGHGDFALDTDTEAGTWILRGHTNYMRNFSNSPLFRMELRVIDAYPGRFRLTGNRQAAQSGRDSQFQPSGTPAGLPLQTAVPEAAPPVTDSPSRVPTPGEAPEVIAERFMIHSNHLDVRFFPEGGDLVAGLGSGVAVKATGSAGAGIGLQGRVYDDLGNHVAGFVTGRFGLGRFEFTPRAGRKYHARVETADTTLRFDLPGVKETGYTLQVNNSMPDRALVRIETNLGQGLTNTFLIGHIRGEIFCLEKLPEGNMAIINIDKTGFPAGVVHLTLFSAKGMPVAERLMFINENEPKARLRVRKSESEYDHRKKVDLEFELTDGNGDPLWGDFSLSVTDSYVVPSHHERHNIETYLLLSSDLPGTIENPGYFFDSGNADRHIMLDLLMMTQGWRRFKWDDLLAGRYPEIIYPPGTGHIIDGRVRIKDRQNKPVMSRVILSALGDEFFAESQVTDEEGNFYFGNLHFHDTTTLVLQGSVFRERRAARRERRGIDDSFSADGDNWVEFQINEPELSAGPVDIAAATVGEEVLMAYIEDSKRDPLLSHIEDIWHLHIEEVEIRRRHVYDHPTFRRARHGTPMHGRRFVIDSIPDSHHYMNTLELIGKISPWVYYDYGSGTLGLTSQPPVSMFAGGGGIAILLDGMPVRQEFIRHLPVAAVSFFDVLRFTDRGVYGGTGSMITIFSRSVDDGLYTIEREPSGIISLIFPGYYRAREFYSPRYDEPGPHHDQPDYRTTLFWEPEIKTGADGRAKVSFFTSDKASVYRIIVEGITETGIPLVKTKEFRVQQGAGN
jgi:hypothetical protein